jgi:signal transduction histidine kinase
VQAAALLAGAIAAFAIVTRAVPSGDAAEPMMLVYEAALGAIAVLLASRVTAPRGATVADLVVELGDSPAGTLRDALAAALGDPTVEIGYRTPDGAYVDDRGHRLALPMTDSERVATFVERDSQRVAVLVHDASVLDEPAVAGAVATATRLSAANAVLASEVRDQVDALAMSRRRLVLAADEQRRRLELSLRDGVERRLVALTEELHAVTAGERDHVRRAEQHLVETVADLRDIARGLHPRELEAGLSGALEALASRCPVAVVLAVDADIVTTDEEASAAYYVCAEALANVAKHASAATVTVQVAGRSNHLLIVVTDDGTGGADPSRGSGLRGLTDRIEALGGRLTVESPMCGGTRLAAELPLGRQLS